MYNQSTLKFLNLSFIEKGKIDWNRIDKNVSFVTLHHPLLDRPVFLEYPALSSLLLTFVSCCIVLIYLSLDLEDREIALLLSNEYRCDNTSKLSRIDIENWIIESSSSFFPFFFPSTDDARSTCTRMIYIEPWLHNVGGILNLYVTQVPGVMKHGRCNVIKYYTPFGETRFIPRSAWNIFSHLRYIYIVIYEGTIGIWCQTIVIDIRNEARFRGARFCATFNRIVELKKKKKSKNSSMFFYILRSKTWSKYCNISTFFSWFYTFSFLNNEKWQLILQNFFKAQQMG